MSAPAASARTRCERLGVRAGDEVVERGRGGGEIASGSCRMSELEFPNSSMSKGLSYRDAGVDIDAGDALVEAIKPFARRTMRPEVLAGIGGFGALCEIPKKYREPVLVSGTDGVGTKLKLAFAARPATTRSASTWWR